MSHRLLVSSRANSDIVAAYTWYEERMRGLGLDFIRQIDAALLRVERSPQIFRPRRGKMRMAMTNRFPFAIYFIWDETAGAISIRRVLHFSQNAGTHLGM